MNRHHRRAAARQSRVVLPNIGFAPAAHVVLSHDGRSLSEAMASGRVAALVPIHCGNLAATEPTAMLEAVIEAGGAIVMAFESARDAREFQSRMAARTCPPPPVPTHRAPEAVQ